MSKKNRKINNIILIIIVIILLGGLLILFKNDIKNIFNKNNDTKEEKPLDDEKDKEEEIDPLKEYKETSNYKLINTDRYIAYKGNNPDLSYEDVVTRVNIGLDKDFYSLITPADTSKGNLLLMNKYLKLASDYEPNDLEEVKSECFISGNLYVRNMRKEAKEAFERLCTDSKANGTPVYGQSGYRPYSMQEKLYNSAVKNSGQKVADSDTARPGHSEHQTGLTMDVSSTKGGNMLSFHKTESFTWMQNNAHKYGFILRYLDGKTHITGFTYESWHYRYVGIETATDIHNNYPNLTYDEYYYKFIDNK